MSPGIAIRALLEVGIYLEFISIHSPIVLQAFLSCFSLKTLTLMLLWFTFVTSVVLIRYLTLTRIPSQLRASWQHSPVTWPQAHPGFAFVVLVWAMLPWPRGDSKCQGNHSEKVEMTTGCSNQGRFLVEASWMGKDGKWKRGGRSLYLGRKRVKTHENKNVDIK